MRRVVSKLLLAGIASLLPLAAGADEAPKPGGTLVFAVNAVDPPTYDCHGSALFSIIHLLSPHYSTLLRIDPEKYPEVKGDTAESWTVSPDYQTYTFRLKPDVRFHDGTVLTSEDVRATYERIRNPPVGVVSVRQGTASIIHSIDTPDPRTVIFRLREPSRSMIYSFALPWNCLYSAARLKADPRFPAKNVMGTGPFRFVEHATGAHWVGQRFEQYHQPGRPYLDGFRAIFTQGAALINGLQGGQFEADFRSITPANKERLMQTMGDNIRILESPWITPLMIVFNAQRKPFDDPRVRRALNLAVDRWKGSEALSRQTFMRYVGAYLRPGYKLAAREEDLVKMPGFSHDIEMSRAEGRRLLKEAGAEGLKFKLASRAITNLFTPGGVFLIDQWRQIGVTVELQDLTEPAYNEAQSTGAFEVMLAGEGDAVDEPDFQLIRYISADIAPANRARYIDRELDGLYDRQRVLPDDQRYRVVRQFEQRMLEQSYIVPVLWWHRIVAMSPRIRGWHMGPSHLISQDLETVWLER
jgi:peptide/nickel transport system substrate-binding protein